MSQQAREHQNQYKISFVSKIIATGFFSGYAPIAPGTAGSLVAVLIYWFFINSNLQLFLLLFVLFILGLLTSDKFEKRDGHDPSIVVVDEMVGMWVSLLFVEKKILTVSISFLFFRVMDVIKPPPAKKFDNMTNGLGIMMDDIIAGVYANILTQILHLFLK
jgi:phosphatidylglycerophosphatase A